MQTTDNVGGFLLIHAVDGRLRRQQLDKRKPPVRGGLELIERIAEAQIRSER